STGLAGGRFNPKTRRRSAEGNIGSSFRVWSVCGARDFQRAGRTRSHQHRLSVNAAEVKQTSLDRLGPARPTRTTVAWLRVDAGLLAVLIAIPLWLRPVCAIRLT